MKREGEVLHSLLVLHVTKLEVRYIDIVVSNTSTIATPPH
jgi:hypothetical protein